MNENRGIINTGTNFGSQNVASGRNVRVTQIVSGAETSLRERNAKELADLLRALQDAVQRERDQLQDPDEVQEVVTRVAEELGEKERPSKLTLRGMLHAIADAASTATAVSGAALALADAIGHLL